MGARPPTARDRWITIHRPARSPRPVFTRAQNTAIQVFYDSDGDSASTAGIFIEEMYDDSPIPTGILDSEGEEIFRIPWRDTVPVGFHFRPDQYDDEGNFIGDDEE